jgi:hypothetical protein
LSNVTLEGTTAPSLIWTVPVKAASLKTIASLARKSVGASPGTTRRLFAPPGWCQTGSAVPLTSPCQRTESPETRRESLLRSLVTSEPD